MHVDTDLSAYLDGELAPADRALVDAHLAGCERCRARLTELRATVSLIGALAAPRPSRSLVPRITERFNWLRPLRSFSTVASGAFLLIFMVTAIARGGGGLGGSGTTAALPQASAAAERAATAATAATPPQVPAPAAAAPAPGATAAATPAADAALRAPFATAAPTSAAQTAPKAAATTDPARADAQRSGDAFGLDAREGARSEAPARAPYTDPLLWLGLTVIAAIVAIAAHWRLRTR
ncbi:MAG TPA: zf-HC2 domain-containing protein [Candidatus Limnocylindria bacterium]